MEHISTNAIILRVRNIGSLDRMVTLLTPDHGRMVAVARSARRSFKRFCGCLNLISEIDCDLSVRPGREIAGLEGASLVEPFEGIIRSYPKLATASAGAELADRISHGQEEAGAMYAETRSFLAALASGSGRGALTAYKLRVLAHTGFRPELEHCVTCGRAASVSSVRRNFDLHRGGLVCPRCLREEVAERSGRTPDWIMDISHDTRTVMLELLNGPGYSTPITEICSELVARLVTERLGRALTTRLSTRP
ncbi:MAG: DNA repair protein RecO [Myxococcota bacterium]|jgi:DNA repair protein RecO (recombination protein O)